MGKSIISGVSEEQRGLRHVQSTLIDDLDDDGYDFPRSINKILLSLPILSKLPFMPKRKHLLEVLAKGTTDQYRL